MQDDVAAGDRPRAELGVVSVVISWVKSRTPAFSMNPPPPTVNPGSNSAVVVEAQPRPLEAVDARWIAFVLSRST